MVYRLSAIRYLLVQCWRELFDLLRAFEILYRLAAIEGAFVALGFASAQVRFADMRTHHLAGRRDLEPLGSGFVCLDFGHAIISSKQGRGSELRPVNERPTLFSALVSVLLARLLQ